jgi:transketolase
VLSRQDLPVLPGSAMLAAEGVERGAYVLVDTPGGAPEVILIATGSEVALALAARERLADPPQHGNKREPPVRARVVSMPCQEHFAEQEPEYRESVLPAAVTARVAVEAASPFGWERWIGARGRTVTLARFGASAPGETNLERLGFTVEAVCRAARAALGAG